MHGGGDKEQTGTMITKIDKNEVHERQQSYVDRIAEQGFDYGLTVAKAFIESIRDLGYKSTANAINENIDNAGEAGAENIHVAFGYREGSRKPVQLAIMDDGVGMVPGMLRASVVWGGTDRHGSRNLFGRYGYGLPSSAVSQGRRFSVYSRADDGPFYCVTMDLDEIAEGKYISDGRVQVPEAVQDDLPAFVTEYADEHFPGGAAALQTVIVWDKLDRLTYRTADGLENHLVETFGVTYRNLIRSLSISVNGNRVEPVDPLFTTEGARFYDLDEDRAEAFEPLTFEVRDRDSRDALGTVRVRFSVMPPTFGRIDKKKEARGKNRNPRAKIYETHNGLVVLRAGREIDVVTKGLPTTFGNYDRYIGVEVDFPASLDEYFGVTTHKQQITLSEAIVTLLNQNGIWQTVEKQRRRFREMLGDLNSSYDEHNLPDGGDEGEDKRPSEMAMEESATLDPPAPQSERRSKQADEGKEKAVNELVDKGVPRDQAEQAIETVEKEQPFRVEIERNPDGPFYRVDLRGGQVVLLINSAHRFYTDVYAAVQGREGAKIRQSLEVLLFVIGKCEIDAVDERELFYTSERIEWSKRLNTALAKLGAFIDLAPDDESTFEDEDVPAEADVTA
jgi:hypothetical protein